MKPKTMDLLWIIEHGIGSHILLVPIPLVKGLAPIQLALWRLTLPLVMMNHGAGGGVPQTFTGQGDTNEVDNHSHILVEELNELPPNLVHRQLSVLEGPKRIISHFLGH